LSQKKGKPDVTHHSPAQSSPKGREKKVRGKNHAVLLVKGKRKTSESSPLVTEKALKKGRQTSRGEKASVFELTSMGGRPK